MAEHLTFEKASRFFASNLTFRLREKEIRDFVNTTSDVFELSGTDEEKCQEITNRFVEALKGNQTPFTYIAGDIPLKLNVDDIARVLVTDAGYKADALDQAINYVQDVWGGYVLDKQNNDSPFAYHLYLKTEIEKAIENNQIKKYHFNFLRNILEKTSTFLGYKSWGDLLPGTPGGDSRPYESRVINISSHSKHSAEESTEPTDNDKRVLGFLMQKISSIYHFK